MRECTTWIDPLEAPASLEDACDIAVHNAESISTATRKYHPNLLLPTHYGQWPQARCKQNLPPDLLVGDDPQVIGNIRTTVESKSIGFGAWGVPYDLDSPPLAASHARIAGYYVNNIEPGPDFWQPGDNSHIISQWWEMFWNELGEHTTLDGSVGVTLIPNTWGLEAFKKSVQDLEGGANLLILEAYGGPNTPEYPNPDCWPIPSAGLVRQYGYTKPLACMLSADNLVVQWKQAQRLGIGNIHVWYAR